MPLHIAKAVIFVPSSNYETHAARCHDHIDAMGYEFAGIVCDDWATMCDYIYDGRANVGVVATADYLSPDRTPRVEFVSHYVQPPPAAPAGRRRNTAPVVAHRSRLIRRDEG